MLEELENAKDNTLSKIKEAAGQITKDQTLELSGKLQSLKADVGEEVDKMKEKLAEKANNAIDHVVESKKSKD